jgi:DNA-directed RNA polymerase specialized sigma24 family protein
MARDNQDPDRLSTTEVRSAFDQLTEADWARAERMAGLAARGLSGVTGEDLLHEALVQLMGGDRRFPRSEHPLVVLKTAMRSEASNIRKSAWVRRREDRVAVEPEVDPDRADSPEDARRIAQKAVDFRTPEDEAIAKEHIDALDASLAEDPDAELVALAWADGLRGDAAIKATGLDAKAYDAARKRLLRKEQAARSRGDKP